MSNIQQYVKFPDCFTDFLFCWWFANNTFFFKSKFALFQKVSEQMDYECDSIEIAIGNVLESSYT